MTVPGPNEVVLYGADPKSLSQGNAASMIPADQLDSLVAPVAQSDVMDAVQRMRKKAHGNLQTTEQQKAETKVIENKSLIVIEQADPQVVYVPSYDPVVVSGPPVYPSLPSTTLTILPDITRQGWQFHSAWA